MNQQVVVSKSELYEEISDYLVQNNKLKESDLLKVNQLREQISAGLLPALLMKEQAGGDGLPALLIKLSVCSEKNVAEAIVHVSDLELATVDEYPEDPPLEDKVSARFFKEYRVVVIQENMGEVVVAIVDPTETFALDALQLACKKKIRVRIGILSEIDLAIEKQFGSGKSLMGQIIENMDVDDVSDDDIEQLKDLASEAPVIRIVNLIMQRALEYRAS
ncbi:MAG: type II secretion system protein GspE, partial [Gammaproteobacteria bacterium]|nr:type II secretion system protein GspE [Gammaproteobacteria bacterium]